MRLKDGGYLKEGGRGGDTEAFQGRSGSNFRGGGGGLPPCLYLKISCISFIKNTILKKNLGKTCHSVAAAAL